jgi:rhodanese-related sulfurtransferase
MTTLKTLPADQLKYSDPNNGIILDVRTKMEHLEKSIAFPHTHVPLDELNPDDFMMRHGLDKDSEVYILCRSGKRATQAAQKFLGAGYHNVYVIEGGIMACEDCGHNLKGHGVKSPNPNNSTTKRPISLERQVRITAGALTATGALLSFVVDPVFSLIPLFIGSGLIFAGITDRCGMALLLTKAPWNQVT